MKKIIKLTKLMFVILGLMIIGSCMLVVAIPIVVGKVMGETTSKLYTNSNDNLVDKFKKLLARFRVINFMLVGGIGYIVNMVVYYPLTLWFKDTVIFLGQQFYLPPFLVSSFVAIACNYYLNKISTFKDYRRKNLGYLKYLATCSLSLSIEMVLIFLFVQFLGVLPIIAVAMAILIVFVARYFVVSRIVWSK